MRLALLTFLFLAGCSTGAPPEASGVVRPLPIRTVEGVRVVGFFDAEAVRAITTLVRAETTEPILSIAVPTGPLNAYHFGGAETLPEDVAEVMTGQACDGRCGGGSTFSLAFVDGVWTITATGIWTG